MDNDYFFSDYLSRSEEEIDSNGLTARELYECIEICDAIDPEDTE